MLTEVSPSLLSMQNASLKEIIERVRKDRFNHATGKVSRAGGGWAKEAYAEMVARHPEVKSILGVGDMGNKYSQLWGKGELCVAGQTSARRGGWSGGSSNSRSGGQLCGAFFLADFSCVCIRRRLRP